VINPLGKMLLWTHGAHKIKGKGFSVKPGKMARLTVTWLVHSKADVYLVGVEVKHGTDPANGRGGRAKVPGPCPQKQKFSTTLHSVH
jgi:hypothetical protein